MIRADVRFHRIIGENGLPPGKTTRQFWTIWNGRPSQRRLGRTRKREDGALIRTVHRNRRWSGQSAARTCCSYFDPLQSLVGHTKLETSCGRAARESVGLPPWSRNLEILIHLCSESRWPHGLSTQKYPSIKYRPFTNVSEAFAGDQVTLCSPRTFAHANNRHNTS